MEGYSTEIFSLKLSGVSSFSRELQNSVTLNQLAKKLALILQNKEQRNQMLEDFSQLKFRNVEEEVSHSFYDYRAIVAMTVLKCLTICTFFKFIWFCGPNRPLLMGVRRVVEDCLLESLTMQQLATRVEGVWNRMLPSNSLSESHLFEAVRDVVLHNLFYT